MIEKGFVSDVLTHPDHGQWARTITLGWEPVCCAAARSCSYLLHVQKN